MRFRQNLVQTVVMCQSCDGATNLDFYFIKGKSSWNTSKDFVKNKRWAKEAVEDSVEKQGSECR